jgi:hypothetical protein
VVQGLRNRAYGCHHYGGNATAYNDVGILLLASTATGIAPVTLPPVNVTVTLDDLRRVSLSLFSSLTKQHLGLLDNIAATGVGGTSAWIRS